MPLLTRIQVKNLIVKPALKAVADFDSDFENFTFDHFHDFSKTIFVTKLSENLSENGYDVLLSDSEVGKWNTFSDCIDYIYDEHFEL